MNEDGRETCQLVGGYYDGEEAHVYPATMTLLKAPGRPRLYLDGTQIDWSQAAPGNPVKDADKMDWSSAGPRMTYVRVNGTKTFIPLEDRRNNFASTVKDQFDAWRRQNEQERP
jgi:hypothetical protein